MWLDLAVLLILAGFALAGLLRGGLATGMRLLTFVGAYASAIVAALLFGAAVSRYFDWPALVGPPAAGAVVFLATYVAIGLVAAVVVRRERRHRSGPRSLRDRLLGACFGLVRGAAVAALVCVLVIWIDALRAVGGAPSLPEMGPSRAAAVTGQALEAGVEAVMSDSGATGRVVARVVARPATSIVELQAVLDHPRIAELQQDRLFWTYVESGAVDSALNRASFIGILRDRGLIDRLAALGVIDRGTADDPVALRDHAADALRELGPRIRGLSDDPELRRLLADPEIAAMMASGNTLGLLAHRGFRSFVTTIASR